MSEPVIEFPLQVPFAPSGWVKQEDLDATFTAALNQLWRQVRGVGPMARGSVGVPSPGANQVGSAPITFPPGLFASAPKVFTNPSTNAPGTGVIGTSAVNETTTGATINCTRKDAVGGTQVEWVAVSDA